MAAGAESPPAETEPDAEDYGAVVLGRVIDESGEPIAGAAVTAGAEGRRRFVPIGDLSDATAGMLVKIVEAQAAGRKGPLGGETTTDAEGRYRLPVTTVAELCIWGDRQGYVSARLASRTYSEGEHVVEDLVLPSGLAITGRVTDADGQPVAGANVRVRLQADDRTMADLESPAGPEIVWILTAGASTDARSTTTGTDGQYRVAALNPGDYVVRVMLPGSVPEPGARPVPAGTSGVDFVLRRGATIRGVVMSRAGETLERATVVFVEALAPGDPGPGKRRHWTATTNDDGTFEICGVPTASGTVWAGYASLRTARVISMGGAAGEAAAISSVVATRIVVNAESRPSASTSHAWNPHWIESAPETGRYAVAQRPLSVSIGQQIEGIEIRLDDSLEVTGRVVRGDGTPAAGVAVSATANPAPGLHVYSTETTDPSGQFTLRGLSPVAMDIRVRTRDGIGETLRDFVPGRDPAPVLVVQAPGSLAGDWPAIEPSRRNAPRSVRVVRVVHGHADVREEKVTDGTWAVGQLLPGTYRVEFLEGGRVVGGHDRAEVEPGRETRLP